ncbi:hypothetical protein E2C01_052809 [Portunus trituberculatus]|uniref:Uncharacterized protein n=1 Tax=Portunus trituberculatus TaxID=210409 RepID=A0A5B7GEP3_PORTR|nr:hypothetical protein [Portunus trituberculatus]
MLSPSPPVKTLIIDVSLPASSSTSYTGAHGLSDQTGDKSGRRGRQQLQEAYRRPSHTFASSLRLSLFLSTPPRSRLCAPTPPQLFASLSGA